VISALFKHWGLQLPPIRTARLRLVAITPEMLGAETMGRTAVGELLRATAPADWPPEHWESSVWVHILAQYRAAPNTFGWHRYMVAEGRDEQPPQLIGCLGGFPCANGDVEMGYSVADSSQRRGFGGEAACALMAWLLRQPEVRSVSAQAYETSPASIRIMQHCDMVPVGSGDHPGTVRYRRWRSSAEDLRVQLNKTTTTT